MLSTIIKKEILDTIISPKFIFTFLLCTVLIILSVITGIGNYASELDEYGAAVALNKKNLESQPNYGTLAGTGSKINKRPEVLSTLVVGVQESVGRVAKVNISFDPGLEDSKHNSNPVYAVFGALDLIFIVKIVLSLFAILFTYDSIAGERERGTLKLALSNPVPRDRLILGKAIGGFISLLTPLVIPMLLGLVILVVHPSVVLAGEEWARIGLIFLLFLFYLSVFFTLGLLVSARSARSSNSLLVLLFIWVTFVTIIPKASIMIAGEIYPIPSIHEVTAEKDAFLQEIQGAAPGRVNKWVADNPSDNTPEWQEKFRIFLEDIQQELTALIDKKNAEIEEAYQAKRRSQQNLAMNISRISPASALMFGAMNLARTGLDEHESFLNSIKSYKPVFTKWVNEKMMRSLNFDGGEQPKPDVSDMPLHTFSSESLNRSLARVIPDYVAMAVMILIFFAAAFVSFLRYDVR